MKEFLNVLNHWVDVNLCFWVNVLFTWLILCVPDKIIGGEVIFIFEDYIFVLGQAPATPNFWFTTVTTFIIKCHLQTQIFCFSFSFIRRYWIFLWPNTIIFRFLGWSSCQFLILNNKASDGMYSKVSSFLYVRWKKCHFFIASHVNMRWLYKSFNIC